MGILAADCAALDNTESKNDWELNEEVGKRQLHRMAMNHNFLEIWQCSQTLRATRKESHTQNKQLTAVACISDNEEMLNAFQSNFQHNNVAAFKLSQRPPLGPAFSAKDLPGG